MKVRVFPTKLKGVINIPSSKSLAHRAIICGALADGDCVINNVYLSRDIQATINCLKALGSEIVIDADKVTVKSRPVASVEERVLDCDESGSTLRFMLPIALAIGGKFRFVGKGKLGVRPLDVFFRIFDKEGIKYSNNSTESKLDLTVEGKLDGDSFNVRGDVSSQFISGLLFAIPLSGKSGKITIDGELQSASYINLTLQTLESFGISVVKEKDGYSIASNQKYKSTDYTVESDFSQSAFFLTANYLGSNIDIANLNSNSLQGDKVIVEMLDALGSGNVNEFDGSDCPDIIPIFSLACALTKGEFIIKNLSRLRIKECDRLSATVQELNKLGAKTVEGVDYIKITGVERLVGGVEVDAHNDHRMAMTLAIAATVCEKDIIINDAESVEKSYPTFFEAYESIGGIIE